jgi:2-amino-4-hydroxy-6-hydroxymethyldihydropteridine diphosphokinase
LSGHGRRIAVAFGSNLGDRRRNILDAAAAAGGILSDFKLSSLIETAPVGVGLEGDPAFLNAVGLGHSSSAVREIFEALREIETRGGRMRSTPGAPRTIDVDLILAGDDRVNERDLRVPHPRFRDRLFVLEPLVEIAPDLRDPVTGLTVRQLLDERKSRA